MIRARALSLLAALALTAGALPSGAQEVRFYTDAVEGCLEMGNGEVCIGMSADACMAETPGGFSTVGMGGCLDAERAYWDNRLNESYASAMEAAKRHDVENDTSGRNILSEAEALREMQRAWIPFRDRKCDHARSQWGGGSGGGPAMLSCLMEETGRQALYLERRLGQ